MAFYFVVFFGAHSIVVTAAAAAADEVCWYTELFYNTSQKLTWEFGNLVKF